MFRNVFLINDQTGFALFSQCMAAADLREAFILCPFNWDQLLALGRGFFQTEPGQFDATALPILETANREGRLWLEIREQSIDPLLAKWGYPAVGREIYAVMWKDLRYREFVRKGTRLRPVPTEGLEPGWLLNLVLIEEEVLLESRR
jgi:hypothetical protein